MTSWGLSAGLAGLVVPDDRVERAGDVAREVTARPEFQAPQRTPLQRAGDWLGDVFAEAVSALGSGPGGGLVGWLVLGAAVALVVLAATRLAGGGWGGLARPGRAEAVVDPRWDGERWRVEAARLRAGGDHAGALRATYQALAADLAQRGLVDPPAATARELLARAAAVHPAAAEPLGRATEVFEATWYGGGAVGPDDLDRFDALVVDVLAATRPAARPGVGGGP